MWRDRPIDKSRDYDLDLPGHEWVTMNDEQYYYFFGVTRAEAKAKRERERNLQDGPRKGMKK